MSEYKMTPAEVRAFLGAPTSMSPNKAADLLGLAPEDLDAGYVPEEFDPEAESVLVYREGLYIVRRKDGAFWTIAGRDEIASRNLPEVEAFLAENMRGEMEPLRETVPSIDETAQRMQREIVGDNISAEWSEILREKVNQQEDVLQWESESACGAEILKIIDMADRVCQAWPDAVEEVQAAAVRQINVVCWG